MLSRALALATVAFALSILTSTSAMGTAQRTFVASNGSDASPCSLAQPCRGFARAITQTSPGGEVIVLDSAGYGPVTITKSVSVIAPAGIYAGISVFSGDGVTVNAPGAIVVLRGLSISGQGGNNGISLLAAARLRVENCLVSGMHVAGISHTAAAPDAELIVLDTVVRDNLDSGVYFFANIGSLVLDHVRSEHNGGDGASITPSAGSIGALATITDSVFTHNEGNGIAANSVSGATVTIVVERSVMASNGQNGFVAISPDGAGVVSVSRSMLNDNGSHGLAILGYGGSIKGIAVENVAHRNSENGIRLDGTASNVLLKGNAGNGNLSTYDLVCLAPGSVYTDRSNAFLSWAGDCPKGDPTF
jgi:hypothetical protein